MDAGDQSTTRNLIDRKERGVAELLTRFNDLVALACAPVEPGATKEVAAAQALQMDVETTALIRAVEELHIMTRQLKELWLFGPLRGIGEGEGEGKIDEDAVVVEELLEKLISKSKLK
ncbi:hypothetical protein K3495_g6305 [Podosphaera aphanis]|nr:hypothetical protein K3495_g6305 [Podosphaera aphanis]